MLAIVLPWGGYLPARVEKSKSQIAIRWAHVFREIGRTGKSEEKNATPQV